MVWKWLRRFRSRNTRTPQTTASGTYLDLRVPQRIVVGPPSLYQIKNTTRMVYITWGARVRVQLVSYGHIRQHLAEVKVVSIHVGERVSIKLANHGVLLVPKPFSEGHGTWGELTLLRRAPNRYTINVDQATGKVISIDP